MNPFPNKIRTSCHICGVEILPRAGWSRRGDNGWESTCNSTRCLDAAGWDIKVPGRKLHADGRVEMPYDPQALPLLRSMPGARWNPEGKFWSVSTEIKDRDRVVELAERIGLEIAPEWMAEPELPAPVVEAMALAERVGLYPYQIEGVKFLTLHPRTLMADDMGLGKTAQSLIALPMGARAVVVCPASLKHNWSDEITRWRPDLTAVIVSGRGNMVAPATSEVVIVNYDILPDDPAPFRGVNLILDEVHAAKNYKAKRTKRVTAAAAVSETVWAMTGTPLPNRPLDLWGVLSATDMARDVFGGFSRFVSCFNGYKGRYGYEFRHPSEESAERLRRVMIRRTKAEVLPDLPTKTYRTIRCDLPDHLREEMDAVWDDYADDTREGIRGNRLPAFEAMSQIRAELAKARIPAMLEIVSSWEEAETPLVVFSAHRAPVDNLATREGWAAITGDTPSEARQQIVKEFTSGALKGIALTIQAGGTGLTLTEASDMLFVDLAWRPADNAQAEDRICRIGQTSNKVQIIRMVSDHVLDQHVTDLLASKEAMVKTAIESEIAYTAPEESETTTPVEEDAAEWEARVTAFRERKAAAEAARDAREASRRGRKPALSTALHRAGKVLRKRGVTEVKPLDPEVLAEVIEAYNYMVSVCDGAQEKDGVGFNAADAGTARALALHLDHPETQVALLHILRGYPRQVGGFESLHRN